MSFKDHFSGHAAVYASFAWPVWAALNAKVSTFVTYVAGTATIALALFVRQVLAIVSVRAVFDRLLKGAWRGLKASLLHGGLKTAEKVFTGLPSADDAMGLVNSKCAGNARSGYASM